MLRTRKLDAAASDRALEALERNAKLQKQLVEDLLEVSHIIQGKLSLTVCPINLVTIIEAAIEIVRSAADAKGIQLQCLLDQSVGLVSGDANRLQQVMWNLLSNAIKFTPEGGQVQVQLTRVATRAEIAVSDTGIGIKPEFLPYVFDRFQKRTVQQQGLMVD